MLEPVKKDEAVEPGNGENLDAENVGELEESLNEEKTINIEGKNLLLLFSVILSVTAFLIATYSVFNYNENRMMVNPRFSMINLKLARLDKNLTELSVKFDESASLNKEEKRIKINSELDKVIASIREISLLTGKNPESNVNDVKKVLEDIVSGVNTKGNVVEDISEYSDDSVPIALPNVAPGGSL